ncbi:hypothetical protein [Pseudomonas antarctica]
MQAACRLGQRVFAIDATFDRQRTHHGIGKTTDDIRGRAQCLTDLVAQAHKVAGTTGKTLQAFVEEFLQGFLGAARQVEQAAFQYAFEQAEQVFGGQRLILVGDLARVRENCSEVGGQAFGLALLAASGSAAWRLWRPAHSPVADWHLGLMGFCPEPRPFCQRCF